jgi:hypothetical protein
VAAGGIILLPHEYYGAETAMRTLSLKIPLALEAKLEAVARHRGATKSAVLREILERHLSSEEGQPRGSILAAAKDLVGCIHGPSDLSSASRHLKGYGR